MKFAKIFFGFAVLVSAILFVSPAKAQVSSCTHSGQSGTCVLGSSDCANGSVYGGTECTGNNERTLCCVTGGGSGSNVSCTAVDDGSQGTCHASGECPSSASYYHQSSSCSGNTPVCCTSSSGGGSGDACASAGTGYACSASSSCASGYEHFSSRDYACGSGWCCKPTSITTGGNVCTSAGTGYTCLSSCGSGFEPFHTGDSACSSTGRVCCKPTSATTGNPTGGTVDTSTGWIGGLAAVKGGSGLPNASVGTIISNLLTWILAIFGFIAIIGFVISGILYLTAAGNDKQITTAKTAMTWSIVGVIVALVGYVIVKAVNIWLGGGTQF